MRNYILLQRLHHPDFFTQSGEEEQLAALEKTALANKALKTLQHHDLTLPYLLQLKGVLVEGEKFALAPDFLMEMMELNEQLTEMDEVAFKQEVARLEEAILAPVATLISNYDDQSVTPEELGLLKDFYFKKKYLLRILDRMGD